MAGGESCAARPCQEEVIMQRKQTRSAVWVVIAGLLMPCMAGAYQAQTTVNQKVVAPPRVTLPAQARERLSVQPAVAPVSANVRCLSSKSMTLPHSGQGLGCRETPKLIWQTQGCPSNIGCCNVPGNPSASCLVLSPGSTDTVRGNGVY